MEIELNGAKLRVYDDGRIERFGLKQWKLKEETWFELKGCISFNSKSNYKHHQTSINKKLYHTSRIVYLAHNQNWNIHDVSPNNSIDHIDRNTSNNHISNLRIATALEQALNRNTTINAKGYCWDKHRQKWMAYITISKKTKFLGYFKTEEEASLVYQNAVILYRN